MLGKGGLQPSDFAFCNLGDAERTDYQDPAQQRGFDPPISIHAGSMRGLLRSNLSVWEILPNLSWENADQCCSPVLCV